MGIIVLVNKKNITAAAIITLSLSMAWSQTTYTVQQGDTLSGITKKVFRKKIYGPDGKLQEVLKHNPQIKNPNVIYPSQVVNLKEEAAQPIETPSSAQVDTPAQQTETSEQTPAQASVEEITSYEPWQRYAYALYGGEYVSHDQSGSLGEADITGTSFYNFRAGYLAKKSDRSWMAELESARFFSKKASKQLLNLDVIGERKKYLFGIGFQQLPLFTIGTGTQHLESENYIYLNLGWGNDNWKALVRPAVDGFGLAGRFEINRELFRRNDRVWSLNWQNDINYWSLSKDDVDTKSTSISSLLGLRISL